MHFSLVSLLVSQSALVFLPALVLGWGGGGGILLFPFTHSNLSLSPTLLPSFLMTTDRQRDELKLIAVSSLC